MLGTGSSAASAISSTTNVSGTSDKKIHSSCFTGQPRPPPLRKMPTGYNPCLPCGGPGDLVTPVYGRYGSYFDPALLQKPHVIPHHRHQKLVHEIQIKSTSKTKKQELLHRLFPLAPKPYLGPHNIMWNPRVRRGPTLVHFNELEKVCPIPPKGSWAALWGKRKKPSTSNKHPLFKTKGCPTYPNVVIGHKLDLADFSQFLEEQDDPAKNIVLTESETQTEDPSLMGPDLSNCRHNFDIGFHVETQADFCRISAEMRPTVPNPIKQTIRSMSSVLKSQIMSQSLLENGESSELSQIRAQADALEHWIVKEQMRLAKVDRDLCKKLERMKREADLEAEWDKRFEDLKKRVGAGLTAECLAKSVVRGAFASLEGVGVIGADKDAERIRSWVHKTVTEIVLPNREVAWNVLDDIINDANSKGPQGGQLPGQVLDFDNDNSGMSEEGGVSFSTGNFGGDEAEGMDDDGVEDTTEIDTANEDEETGDLDETATDSPQTVSGPSPIKINAKEDKPIVNLLGPKF